MSELSLSVMPVGTIQTNCYFVMNTVTKEAIVIDPGDEEERILAYLNQEQMTLKAILLTHGHFDHMMAASGLASATRARIYCSEPDAAMLSDSYQNVSSMFGSAYAMEPDLIVKDQQILEFSGTKFQVLATPGHTKGSVCYYMFQEHILFAGDTIFFESVGRSDFPTGSELQLEESVHMLLSVLPEDTKVFTGHGTSTTIGYEKKNNPYRILEG